MDETMLLESLMFAADAHKDQFRKGSGRSPYINHLIEVALLLSKQGRVRDIAVLQAAVLHDTLEDTEVTEEDINKKFGEKVLKLVKAVTDDKELSLEERREKQIQTVEKASDEIKLIKLAEHCSNIASIPSSWDRERLKSYIVWSQIVAGKCIGVSAELTEEYNKRYLSALEVLDNQ